MDTKTMETDRLEAAHIGKSVLLKGELSGSEDLYMDGEVEGSIELPGHSLTVGPNGRIRADINSRNVVVCGRVEGNIRGFERVELKKSAVVIGDIATPRVVIEDGAFFKGSIDIQRDTPKSELIRRDPAVALASSPSGESLAALSTVSAASSSPKR